MNNVHSFTNEFTNGINSVGNSVGKSIMFFPTVIPSVYTDEIFSLVKSLENLLTEIFPQYFRLDLSIFWQCQPLHGLYHNHCSSKIYLLNHINQILFDFVLSFLRKASTLLVDQEKQKPLDNEEEPQSQISKRINLFWAFLFYLDPLVKIKET